MAAEFDLGALTGSPTLQEFVGNADNSDTYSFTLSGVTEFSLLLNGMTQDANVYLNLDSNSNGQIDSGESIADSDNSGTSEDRISRTLGAGTYFVEVKNYRGWPSNTDTRYNLTLFTPLSGSGILVDNTLLNSFGNLVSTAAIGAAGEQFFDLSDGGDTRQLELGWNEQFRGGLRALDGNDNITGTSSWDIINGNQGADILRGGGGNDFLRGGRDDDQVFGDDGDDLLNGNFGNDVVEGGAGNDFIRGGRDNDNLRGGDGNDVLVGDFGFDILTGGGGADTFIFRADTETGTDAGIADTIADFSAGDRIFIAGNVSPGDISVVDGGGNAIIQLNTGAILGVALNTSAAAVQGVLGTAGLGDSGLKVG